MRPRPSVLLAGLVHLSLFAGSAVAQPIEGFTITRLVDSDTVPPGEVESFDDFGRPAVADGVVVVNTDIVGGPKAIYRIENGALQLLLKEGDPIPDPPGGVFGDFANHVEFQRGVVLFRARSALQPFPADNLIGAIDGTTPRIVVRENVTQVPGQPPGTVFTVVPFTEVFGLAGSRAVFVARYGFMLEGVYLQDAGSPLSVVVDTSTPGPTGEVLRSFEGPMPDPSGPGIAFRGRSLAFMQAIYISDGGGLQRIVDTTHPVPGGSGNFFGFDEPDIDHGRVLFEGRDTFGSGDDGIYLYDPSTGGVETIVDGGTVLPGGATVDRVGGAALSDGTALTWVDTGAGESLIVWRDGVITELLSTGDQLDGRTVSQIGLGGRPGFEGLFGAAVVEFEELDSDGDNYEAVYLFELDLFSPLEVPTLSAATLALLALLLALAAVAILARGRRPA